MGFTDLINGNHAEAVKASGSNTRPYLTTTNGKAFDMATTTHIKRDLYAEVTDRIVAELARGAAPWIKPWSAMPGCNHPHNACTGRPYSGCNVVLLWMATQKGNWPTMRYLTFKQATELG